MSMMSTAMILLALTTAVADENRESIVTVFICCKRKDSLQE